MKSCATEPRRKGPRISGILCNVQGQRPASASQTGKVIGQLKSFKLIVIIRLVPKWLRSIHAYTAPSPYHYYSGKESKHGDTVGDLEKYISVH